MFLPVRAAMAGAFLATIWTRAFPTVPKPAMKRLTLCRAALSKNSRWTARMASSTRSEGTMTEMFRSEEPCAVARTGMLRRPRAASIRPVAPLWPSTSLPIRQMMENPVSTLSGRSRPWEISQAKHSSAACLARGASAAEMAMHMVWTEEAWVIRMMLIPARERASNSREENPGMPTMPLPSSEIRAMLSELEMPRTSSVPCGGYFSTRVLPPSGSKVSRT